MRCAQITLYNATRQLYSIELGTTRTGSVYLAYVINTDLQTFVADTSFSVSVDLC